MEAVLLPRMRSCVVGNLSEYGGLLETLVNTISFKDLWFSRYTTELFSGKQAPMCLHAAQQSNSL